MSPLALLIFAGVALVAFLLLRAVGRGLGLGRDTGHGLEMDTASLILGIGLWGSLLVLGVAALLLFWLTVPSPVVAEDGSYRGMDAAVAHHDAGGPVPAGGRTDWDELAAGVQDFSVEPARSGSAHFNARETALLERQRRDWLRAQAAAGEDARRAGLELKRALKDVLTSVFLADQMQLYQGGGMDFTLQGDASRLLDGARRQITCRVDVTGGDAAAVDPRLWDRSLDWERGAVHLLVEGFAPTEQQRILAAARYLVTGAWSE